LFYNREDIIEEVIYQIMVADDRKVLRNYRGQSRLKTYLWPVIRNKIVDMIRKERTHHNHHLYQEDLEENIIDPPPPSPNLAVEIEECIAQEPPLEQFIKTSKWIEGLSYQEIMDRAGEGIPGGKSLTAQHIAYVLSVNREKFKKKLKKVIT
jgi:RNA polymerase sigma factor (sigma-70 family)